MGLLVYWIVLDCTGVPNKVANECVCSCTHMDTQYTHIHAQKHF